MPGPVYPEEDQASCFCRETLGPCLGASWQASSSRNIVWIGPTLQGRVAPVAKWLESRWGYHAMTLKLEPTWWVGHGRGWWDSTPVWAVEELWIGLGVPMCRRRVDSSWVSSLQLSGALSVLSLQWPGDTHLNQHIPLYKCTNFQSFCVISFNLNIWKTLILLLNN